MTIGEKIYQLRKSKQWSQEELASKIAISRQALSKWELGNAVPDTENVLQLSKLFGVTTDFLLDDELDDISANSQPLMDTTTQPWVRLSVGVSLVVLSLVTFIGLVILSIFKPMLYFTDSRQYTGFIAFIMGYNLEWFLIGFAVIYWPKVKQWPRKLADWEWG